MSDWIVKGPNLYAQLAKAILDSCQNAPSILHQFIHLVEQYRDALFTDLKETQTQIEQRKNEAQDLQANSDLKPGSQTRSGEGQLELKERDIKLALQNIHSMLTNLNSTESRLLAMRTNSSNGIKALSEMERLARAYIQGNYSSNTSNNEGVRQYENSGPDSSDTLAMVGDAFHFKLDNSSRLTQHKIDAMMQKANQHNLLLAGSIGSATKLSIENVSQADFSMLEKNGFTIQRISSLESPSGQEGFSAFKELENK